jgi:hypothetical protein
MSNDFAMASFDPRERQVSLTADNAHELFVTLEGRRSSFEQVMWQVPSLSIALQAFLFSAAFGAGVPRYAQVIVLFVGLVAVLAAMHLLAKHRYMESLHGQVLALCQRELGWPPLFREQLHEILAQASAREMGAARWNRTWLRRLVIDVPAFNVWMYTLGAFAIADAYLLARALT